MNPRFASSEPAGTPTRDQRSGRDVVKVEIDDDADPHSAWLINTRKPDELAGAIRAIQAA